MIFRNVRKNKYFSVKKGQLSGILSLITTNRFWITLASNAISYDLLYGRYIMMLAPTIPATATSESCAVIDAKDVFFNGVAVGAVLGVLVVGVEAEGEGPDVVGEAEGVPDSGVATGASGDVGGQVTFWIVEPLTAHVDEMNEGVPSQVTESDSKRSCAPSVEQDEMRAVIRLRYWILPEASTKLRQKSGFTASRNKRLKIAKLKIINYNL